MYTMKETCEKVNMPYETLKFYCNEGLIPNISRNKNNHRIFTEAQVNWIENLSCLKNCGMTISEMKYYLELCLLGEATIDERREILALKRVLLFEKIRDLEEHIEYINKKEQFYNDVQSGKTPYFSNLIKNN